MVALTYLNIMLSLYHKPSYSVVTINDVFETSLILVIPTWFTMCVDIAFNPIESICSYLVIHAENQADCDH
jgi:hypothetical protein